MILQRRYRRVFHRLTDGEQMPDFREQIISDVDNSLAAVIFILNQRHRRILRRIV